MIQSMTNNKTTTDKNKRRTGRRRKNTSSAPANNNAAQVAPSVTESADLRQVDVRDSVAPAAPVLNAYVTASPKKPPRRGPRPRNRDGFAASTTPPFTSREPSGSAVPLEIDEARNGLQDEPALQTPSLPVQEDPLRVRRRSRRSRRGGQGERTVVSPESTEAKPRSDEFAPESPDESYPKHDREAESDESESVLDDESIDQESRDAPPGSRVLLINVSVGDEVRIGVLHEGRLEELFLERAHTQSHVGNIYKGRVTNVEPSIQAAFIDFGLKQNGFLHISDVQPQYFPDHKGGGEDVGRKIPRHHRPPIQKCFRRGQEVIVQVTKEGVGTKGPTLTTYLSIPGRYLVMMPGMSRHGVSRRIEDDAERQEMRDLLKELDLPSGMGFIMRTAGLGRGKRDLQRDLNYLKRLWKIVAERIKRLPAPAELYQESDLVTRTIRDVYTADFARIIVDDPATTRKVREFLQLVTPRSKTEIEQFDAPEPLFHHFGIEEEIDRINMRHVPLSSGGSLVIDQTEALVAIDVNSGRFRTMDNAEETAFRINMEAVPEIARQLRLRDLGGLIICDFIDMRMDHHKRSVERALRDELKKHKERARILRMSAFGIIEMTRQRQGPSIKKSIYTDCAHCKGTGAVKTPNSVMLDVMRFIQLAAHRDDVHRITVTLNPDLAFHMLNSRRSTLRKIESETGTVVFIRGDLAFTADQVEYACEDSRGRPVTVMSGASGSTAMTQALPARRGPGTSSWSAPPSASSPPSAASASTESAASMTAYGDASSSDTAPESSSTNDAPSLFDESDTPRD